MKFSKRYLPHYLLILSLFISSFVLQYLVLVVVSVWIIASNRLQFNKKTFFLQLPAILIVWAFISYIINLFTGYADKYSMFFWLMSYLPPFLLMWLILFDTSKLEIKSLYSFYKVLVYFESILMLLAVVEHGTFIVGDPAIGTVGDANLVAYHICVVIIYEIIRVLELYQSKSISTGKLMRSVIEIVYFLVVLLIPESTANLGLLIILFGFMFIDYILSKHLNLKAIAVLIIVSTSAFFVMKDGFVYRRLEDAVVSLNTYNITHDLNLVKLKVYGEILTMQIIPPPLLLTGIGPATFTSRSSVIRIPEDRVNDFPIELPYFKNRLFDDFISLENRKMAAAGGSYGNFASPQTSVISVTVELGLVGLFLFSMFFVGIIRAVRSPNIEPAYLRKFGFYFTLFFVMSLFHLNFWEYPIVSFTYILFISVLIKQGQQAKSAD